MQRERYVIVGASLAGLRAAEALRQNGFEGEIILIGAERERPYHRPPLSKDFLGPQPMAFDELAIQPEHFYRDQRIELRLGLRATRLLASSQRLELEGGERLTYDRLLIATGAEPLRLNVPGSTLPGVVHLRGYIDAVELAERLQRASSVVVVGAGLIGLEVAASARALGKRVTVIEAADVPLRRVLGDAGGAVIAQLHRDQGVDLRLSTTVRRIRGDASVEEVEIADGTSVPADVVVVGIGVRPATDWLAGSGVAVDDGVLVDEFCETNIPGIFAAGDVVRAWNPLLGARVRLEQYGNAHAQGTAAGRSMAGQREPYAPLPSAGSEQYRQRIQVVGLIRGGEELMYRGSVEARKFIAFYLRNERVVGAFALNQARDLPALRTLVSAGVSADRSRLMDEQVPLNELR